MAKSAVEYLTFKYIEIMTVQELIIELQEMNPDAKVRLAIQPNYPFEYDLSGVVETFEDEYIDANSGETKREGEQIVYLEQGEQLGYLPQIARNQIGW